MTTYAMHSGSVKETNLLIAVRSKSLLVGVAIVPFLFTLALHIRSSLNDVTLRDEQIKSEPLD